ncbi:MAG: hypothetical protein J7L86_06285 [Candidatus Marinimicrobia bacterium]|nr:hypothetical protein [Candidatus Neomarinimicrobiota bacterium]
MLVAGFLSADGITQTLEKYSRKSISCVDALLVAGNFKLSPAEQQYFLEAIRAGIQIARFDYNTLPENIQQSFKRQLAIGEYTSEADIESLINNTLVPEIIKILDANKEIRAQSLVSETQRNSFIALKAKEIGITAEQLEQVMNSSYIYIPFIDAYHEKWSKNKKEVDVRIEGGLLWYHVITAENPRVEKFAKISSAGTGSADSEEDYKIDAERVNAKDFAFRNAAQTLATNLEVKIRELDMFKLMAPISEVYRHNIRFPLGRAEGIKLDAPFFVGEWVQADNGKVKLEKSGFVRVSTVSENRRAPGQLSQAVAIKKGNWVKGMMVVEHPRLGIDIAVKPRWLTLKIEEGAFQSDKFAVGFENFNGGVAGVDLDFQCNIASLTKKRQSFLVIGGTGAIVPVKSRVCSRQELFNLFDIFKISVEREQENSFATYFSGHLGYMRKFYFGRFALHGETLLGAQGLSIGGKYDDKDIRIINVSVGGRVNIGLEYALNIDCNVGVFTGYNIFAPMNIWYVKYDEKEEDITNFFAENYPKISSVGSTLGFYIHFSPPAIPFNPFAVVQKNMKSF